MSGSLLKHPTKSGFKREKRPKKKKKNGFQETEPASERAQKTSKEEARKNCCSRILCISCRCYNLTISYFHFGFNGKMCIVMCSLRATAAVASHRRHRHRHRRSQPDKIPSTKTDRDSFSKRQLTIKFIPVASVLSFY